MLIVSISCSKEDDSPPSLLGKWEFTQIGSYENNVLQKIVTFGEGTCNREFYEFKENNQLFVGVFIADCILNKTVARYVYDGKIIDFGNATLFPSNYFSTITVSNAAFRVITLSNTDLIVDLFSSQIDGNEQLIARVFYKRV